MRRKDTNRVVMVIAALLLIAAVAFAWHRSRPIAEVAEIKAPAAPRPQEPPVRATFDWQALGEQTYQARCASCHGEGDATARVPPLRGHAVDLFQAASGRAYLIDFLLYGLAGRIQVGETTYDGRHPIYVEQLSDEEIAAVLNFMLTEWGGFARAANPPLYAPQEIAPHRQHPKTREEVRLMRPQ